MRSRKPSAAGALLLIAGCSSSEVVVVVDGQEFTAADVAASGGAADFVAEARLAALAQRERVDNDSLVAAQVRHAERAALAAAMMERAMRPSADTKVQREAFASRSGELKRRRVHVAQIVLPADADADDVFRRLENGESFAALARAISTDAASAARGGELDPITEGQTNQAFFESAWRLPQAETSLVVMPWGRHILRALEPPREVAPTFEEARGTIAVELSREATAALRQRAEAAVGVTWKKPPTEIDGTQAAKRSPDGISDTEAQQQQQK